MPYDSLLCDDILPLTKNKSKVFNFSPICLIAAQIIDTFLYLVRVRTLSPPLSTDTVASRARRVEFSTRVVGYPWLAVAFLARTPAASPFIVMLVTRCLYFTIWQRVF